MSSYSEYTHQLNESEREENHKQREALKRLAWQILCGYAPAERWDEAISARAEGPEK